MQTRTGFTTAARAETLARLLHGKPDVGEGALERAERVADAVGTDRRRAMVWVRQTLAYEGVTRPRLLGLGFEWWVVNAADTLVVRPREDVPAYAKRVAACTDADVLAVAGAAIDDEIREGVERQHDSRPAYEEARLVVQRAADALANEQPGAFPAAGGMADNLPTAPALRTPLLSFVDHTEGVQQAMADMMRAPGKVPCAVFARLSLEDLELLVAYLRDLIWVVGVLVVDVSARPNEDTYEERVTLVRYRAKMHPRQGIAMIARTIARRLRNFIEPDLGEAPVNGKVH